MLFKHFDETGEQTFTFGTDFGSRTAGRPVDIAGTLQGGTTSALILPPSASLIDGDYLDLWFALLAGPGAGQVTKGIAGYNGVTKNLPISPALVTPPTGSTTFRGFRAQKFAIQNVDVATASAVLAHLAQNGTSTGINFPRWGKDTTTLSCPYGVSVSVGGTGGAWSSTRTRRYRLTGTKNGGETCGSMLVTAVIDSTGKKATLTWTALPGSPDNIRIYAEDDGGGVFAGSAFLVQLAGNAVSYVDDGSVALTSTHAFPTANTSSGYLTSPYGVPPTFTDDDDFTIGDIARGEQVYYWVEAVVAAGYPAALDYSWQRQFIVGGA